MIRASQNMQYIYQANLMIIILFAKKRSGGKRTNGKRQNGTWYKVNKMDRKTTRYTGL